MLREQITEEEYDILSDYHSLYGYIGDNVDYSRQKPIKEILAVWAENKTNLFHLLGNKLIISNTINYTSSQSEKYRELDRFLYNCNCKYNSQQFLNNYRNWVEKTFGWHYSTPRSQALQLISSTVLLDNEWNQREPFEVPMPNGKTYKAIKGTKAIKILSKIASAYNLEGFEEFRLGHSLVLNDKQLNGKLVLSIHPLDYWTMSDNHCNWTSCMSWENVGGYRQGTVEMMNSPYVIEAYLAVEEPYIIDGEYKWSNKKWRQLFVVDKNIICAIKGYPYQQEYLTEEVLHWLAELAKENLGWEYTPEMAYYHKHNIYSKATGDLLFEEIDFKTKYMYNDFDSLPKHFCLCSIELNNSYSIDYSGKSQCIHCGKTDIQFSSENILVCDDCDPVLRCSNCGEIIYNDEYTWVGDSTLCSSCVEELTSYCNGCNENVWNEDIRELTIILDDSEPEQAQLFNENISFCSNCYTDFINTHNIPVYTDGYTYYVKYKNMVENAPNLLPWLLTDSNGKPWKTFEEIKARCPYSLWEGNLSDLYLE